EIPFPSTTRFVVGVDRTRAGETNGTRQIGENPTACSLSTPTSLHGVGLFLVYLQTRRMLTSPVLLSRRSPTSERSKEALKYTALCVEAADVGAKRVLRMRNAPIIR